MAAQEILCSVNSCYYWGDEDKCRAERIMVRFSPTVAQQTKMEVGTIDSDTHPSLHAFCDTFRPKHKGQNPNVNVVRA